MRDLRQARSQSMNTVGVAATSASICNYCTYLYVCIYTSAVDAHIGRTQWPRRLGSGFAAAGLLELRVRILRVVWMSDCCASCVLSGRGLCVELSG
jgi:hypothetical protein